MSLKIFKIMGILNITPDSFYERSRFSNIDAALKRVEEMKEEGADIIDIGGESSRPGAFPVSCEEELNRVIPILSKIKKNIEINVSVDTFKSKVAEEALKNGADIINDITALSDSNMAKLISEYNAKVVLMHMKGTPATMQVAPFYDNLINEIMEFFEERIKIAENVGILRENIIIDPGIGFGKTLEHNIEIIKRLSEFKIFKLPILIGISRKSMIGTLLNAKVEDRLEGSISAGIVSLLNGASILRVHDVKETYRAVKVLESLI